MAGVSDLAILRRILEPLGTALSAEAAQTLLALAFSPADHERVRALLVKNQAGELTSADKQELESYLRVGRVVDLLRSKARQALKARGDGS